MSIRLPEPRSAARILCREAAEAGISIKYTQALGFFAKMLGFQSYNAMQPLLDAEGRLPLQQGGQAPLFSARELATLQAALRYWQREGWISEGHEHRIASAEGALQPLTGKEIDSLCERLSSSKAHTEAVQQCGLHAGVRHAECHGCPDDAPRSHQRESVTVALYEHAHGQDFAVYRNPDDAYRWMEEIAEEWWEHEFPQDPKPQDPAEAAREYFERIEDESFTVQNNVPIE